MQRESDLILEELEKFPNHASYIEQANCMRSAMNSEQADIYDYVSMTAQQPGCKAPIFVHGKAGTGKRFLLNALCLLIRGRRQIVLPCATTPSTALLYPGGRDVHSLFQIPEIDDNIEAHSMIDVIPDNAMLLKEAQVIIWDEFPVTNKAIIKFVNLVLQRICYNYHPFGGKFLVASGDFKQASAMVPMLEEEPTLRQFAATESRDEVIKFLFPRDLLMLPHIYERRVFLSPLNADVDGFNKYFLEQFTTQESATEAANTSP